MTYFKDLTKYHYLKEEDVTFNVGWLSAVNYYEVSSKPQPRLVSKLRLLSSKPANKTRGIHFCELCSKQKPIYDFGNGKRKVLLGSAELRIINQEKKIIYACPDLIIHYIECHKYKPPQEFINALYNLKV